LLILTPDKFFSKNYKKSETSQNVIDQEVDLIKNNFDKIKGKAKKYFYQNF
jgi:hypothetical protein